MTWRKIRNLTLLATALVCLWLSACSSGNKANQVLVNVTGQFSVMVPTQSQTITVIVTGATDVSSAFDCSYTTTPNPTTATPSPKPSASADCSSANGAVGVLSNIQNTSTTAASTATFTAPQTFPDQTKLPNVTVTITATANADKKKTGKFPINFDSGIRIAMIPATATLATTETQLFLVKDLSGRLRRLRMRPASSPSSLSPTSITSASRRPPSPSSRRVTSPSAVSLPRSRPRALSSRTSSSPPPTPPRSSVSRSVEPVVTSPWTSLRSRWFSPRVPIPPPSVRAFV